MHVRCAFVPFLLVSLFSVHGATSAQSPSCEELRANVEAKIRGNGGANFTVEVVEATTKAQSQVVGTCERGSKKLVYVKAAGAASTTGQARPAPSASAAASPKAKPSGVITECADGRVITSGSCKSP
jgi:Protein of unknown function (DUF1161)